jgi:hypothetical protein
MSRACKGIDHAKDLDVDVRILLKYMLGKYGLRVWVGFIWLSVGSGGGLL